MRVLVNAVSIKEGGSLTVLKKLLPAMAAERPDIEWIAAVNPKVGSIDGAGGRINWLRVPTDRSVAHLMWWYEFGLPAAIRQSGTDVLFSVTNYLPRRRIDRPSLLLVQHAGHFSTEFERLFREALPSPLSRLAWREKTNWVRHSAEKADVLIVQTAALADAIAAATRKPRGEIWVAPHGPGWVEHSALPRRSGQAVPWRVGYVSKWSSHKNFPTLLHAIKLIVAAGGQVTLVLTLDPTIPQVRELLSDAAELGVSHVIENNGETTGERLADLYDSLDIFAFPSVCESFGMPMVEAMARGLPMVVADTPEAREITGEKALTFPAYDSSVLAHQLLRLMSDGELRRTQSERSLERGSEFTWTRAARGTIAALEAAIATR